MVEDVVVGLDGTANRQLNCGCGILQHLDSRAVWDTADVDAIDDKNLCKSGNMGCASERVNGNSDFIHEKMEIKT